MPNRQQRLQQAINKLSKYYGFYTTEDLVARISFESLTGERLLTSNNNLPIDAITSEVYNAFLNNSDGCYDMNTLCSKLSQLLTPTDPSVNLTTQKEKIGKIFRICGPSDSGALKSYKRALYGENENDYPEMIKTDIRDIFKSISSATSTINSNSNSPAKETPNLSVIFSNTKLIDIKNRYTNAVVLLLNGIPTIELARAVPYLDIKFIFNRPQVNPFNSRLQGPGLVKYLNGAVPIDIHAANNASLLGLTLGNQIEKHVLSGSDGAQVVENHSIAGMEIFTHPQTLTNADETADTSKRINPVLDKFRPFMGIKDFEVNVVASTGMESYKSAKLNLVLYDRSRMADIADLIKPDLYGRTELLIEYGWIHPEGEETSSEIRNYYGDLINGMRVVEKYGIENSSYTFGDDGVVSISLTLFMKGNSDLSTELVSSDDESVSNSIRELERIQRVIAELRSRVLGQNTNYGSAGTKEVRGVQILDLAQDNFSSMIMNRSTRQQIAQLERSIAGNNRGREESIQLIRELRNLFNQNRGNRSNNSTQNSATATGSTTGAAEAVRQAIVTSVQQKIDKLANDPDPFLADNLPPERNGAERRITGGTQQERNTFNRLTAGLNRNLNGKKVSLAKVLLLFLAQPIAATKKYDDVQLVFYPFNEKAGYASKINVGQFEIDLTFLAEEWVRYKINNVSRSSNMNIKEFIRFLASTMIDDMAATSYGLYDEAGNSFFKQVYENEGATRTQQARFEAPILQQKIENRLRTVTPDGAFVMPQIEIYTECLPAKTTTGTPLEEKSILRIHIYDRLATPYESLGSILRAARSNELGVVGTIPQPGAQTPPPAPAIPNANRRARNRESGNPGIQESNHELATRYINRAVETGLIKKITDDQRSSNENNTQYELSGGPEKLKNFLYDTMPYIIYGAMGSGVKAANLSSMQDPALTTVNLVRSPRSTDILPNGEQPGGLPMRIIPSELSMQTIGCPFISFAQHFFVDFQTGTSADNIYSATTISHKISEGEFTTDIKFTPGDAYGQYENYISRLATCLDELDRSTQARAPGTPENARSETIQQNSQRREPQIAPQTANATSPATTRSNTEPISNSSS